jgi:hypothetical protein
MSGTILAIDPGRSKSGVAVAKCPKYACGDQHAVEAACQIAFHEVVPTVDLPAKLAELSGLYDVDVVVLGNGTGSGHIAECLAACKIARVEIVDEHRTTLDARKRFFRMNPPRGLNRMIPLSLQVPCRPYDDYVAIILAERYLASGEPDI